MARKAKLPRHVYWRGTALYAWFYGANGEKIKRSTGCTDPASAAAVLAEWERDSADPSAAARSKATLKNAFDALDADRAALIAQGKKSEASIEYYEAARAVWCRYAGRLIKGEHRPDEQLDRDELKDLVELGGRAALSTVGVPFVDGFVAHRRAAGITESTIAKNRSAMRSALELAQRAELWDGPLSKMFPAGFKSGYEPRRVRISHEDADRLLAYFDSRPHRRAQVAFALAVGAELAAILRAMRTDLAEIPVPLHGTKTSDRARSCFVAFAWQKKLLKIARKGLDGSEGRAFTPWNNSTRDLALACGELELPRLSLHSLRHIFGVWALDDGISPYEVAKALGHRDLGMLLRTYDDRDPEAMQRRAVEQAKARANVRNIETANAKKTLPTRKAS